ncbi:MAG: AraC family transcriptional regulator ligand-binding domain-containing protein [Steroidobacteraceae bacterium]
MTADIVAGATVRLGPLASIPAVLTELGIEPEGPLGRYGLDVRSFDDPERRVTFEQLGGLLEHCAQVTACEHFGFRLGQRSALSSFGLFGEILATSATLMDALRNAALYLHLHDTAALGLVLQFGETRTALGYAIMSGDQRSAEQVIDGTIAMVFGLLRELCGPGWQPLRIQLSRRRPADDTPYRRHFRAPVEYDSAVSAVVFDARWLGTRLRSADPVRHRALLARAAQERPGGVDELPSQVGRLVQSMLYTTTPTAAQTAAMFGLTTRTLERRLAAHGTGFRAVLKSARSNVARHLLAHTDLPVSEIASVLGYADSTGFSRAFRLANGLDARTYRKWRSGRG